MNPILRMWRYFDGVRKELYLASFLSAITIMSAVALMATSGWLISRAAQMPPVLELGIAVVGVRTFALSRGVARYAERLVSHNATFKSLSAIRKSLYQKLESLAPSGLSAFRNGDLMSRLVADVDEIQNLPLRVFLPVTSGLAAAAFSVIAAWLIFPVAGLVLLVTISFVAIFSPWLTSRLAARSERETAGLRGELTEELNAFFTGSADLLMLDAADLSLAKISDLDTELTTRNQRLASSLGIASALTVLAQGTAILVSVATAIQAVNANQLEGLFLVVVALIPMAAFESVASFPAAALSLARVRGSAQGICDVLDASDPVEDPEASAQVSGDEISVSEVSAHWPGSARSAIAGIDLVTAPGSRIGLVGGSGSGKSTIAAVIAKFLLPSDGKYSLGTIDSINLSGESVRDVVKLSLQDSHLFATSIAENLKLAWPEHDDSPTDEQLWAALDKALLSDWVHSLPKGLDTVIGERGTSMSGGQRQRLIAARMFLADPDVWILDEPTEHLDDELADKLIANLASRSIGKTLIVATHRILDTKSFDHVLVLDQGVVAESGSPIQLVNGPGIYQRLQDRESLARAKSSS
ncbi:MAG: thiol reductant ABC exporter subunit CydC [Actinomycetes bacterium]